MDEENTGSVAGSVVFTMPQTFSLEQPTMALRWYNGILEQAFTRTSVAGSEIIWKAVPNFGSGA